MATSKKLYESAIRLEEEERVGLVGMSLESLEIGDDRDVETAWLQKIEQRVAKLDSGSVGAVPWTEVRSRVFESGANWCQGPFRR